MNLIIHFRKINCLLGCLLLAHFSFAQMPEVEFKYSYQIERELSSGSMRPSTASYEYTYIGDYLNAINTYGLPVRWGLDTLHIDQDYAEFSALDAGEYISKQADMYRITVINEAHNKPQHRVFVRSLLQKMYDKGYRHLGLECLINPMKLPPDIRKDSLDYWGYPILSFAIGTYTREPQMANLIREALRIGYTVFPYEKTDEQEERDLVQAQNIFDFVQNRSEGKVLILCGWDHAIESDILKRRNAHFMAYHLRRLLNEDILTIDQDVLSEDIAGNESPGYRMLSAERPSVFVDQQGGQAKFFREFKHFDILIYHPPTYFIQGRPSWLYRQGTIQHHIDFEKITSFPIIVKAIPADNDLRATPVDIIEIKHRYERKPLLLTEGSYILELLYDQDGSQHIEVDVSDK